MLSVRVSQEAMIITFSLGAGELVRFCPRRYFDRHRRLTFASVGSPDVSDVFSHNLRAYYGLDVLWFQLFATKHLRRAEKRKARGLTEHGTGLPSRPSAKAEACRFGPIAHALPAVAPATRPVVRPDDDTRVCRSQVSVHNRGAGNRSHVLRIFP